MKELISKALYELNHIEAMKSMSYRRGDMNMFYSYCDMADGARRVLAAFGVNVRLDLETMEYVAV